MSDYYYYYVLDDAGNHVAVTGKQWHEWVIDRESRGINWRTVALSELEDVAGRPNVSTVFLGRNHQYDPDGPPILYETMIFWADTELDGWQNRYLTRDEALKGHDRACSMVRALAKIDESGVPIPDPEEEETPC